MISRIVLAAALASTTAFFSIAEAATLKVSSCLPRNHDYIEAYFETFFEPLNAKNASVKLRFLGGPEVTPRGKQAPALKRGLIDMIICPTSYYAGVLAEGRLPGLQRRSLEEMKANGAYDMLQEAWGKGLNARILAWVHFSGQKFFIYTNFKPKLSTKTGVDLTGHKMRSVGLYNAPFKAMGATPIAISPSDVYAALERGLVDGVAWPWGSIAKFGWQRFLKYRIEPGFFGATLMTLVNKSKYAKLTAEERGLIEEQARIYQDTSDALIVKKGKADDAKLKAAGIEFIELKGAHRNAYLNTIYDSKWAENDSHTNYRVDYKTLKAKMLGGGS